MVVRTPLRCTIAAAASSIQPQISRTPATTRWLHHRMKAPAIPEPIPFCPDAQTFLTLIGRDLSQHSSKIEDWNTLFSLTSPQLKDLGVEPARSRKYLLRWLNKFRNGQYGLGGDLKHVNDGTAYVRLCEVPADSEIAHRAWIAKHGENETSDGQVPSPKENIHATITQSPGVRQLILNIPVSDDATTAEAASPPTADEGSTQESGTAEAAEPGKLAETVMRQLTEADLHEAVPIRGLKKRGSHTLYGSYALPIKGTSGRAVMLKVTEGLWEHKRGHKVDGGERRKAEVRAKRRSAERRAGAR